MFVALVIQHAMHMRHVICGLPGSKTFFHIISKTARVSKRKMLLNYKICFIIIHKFVSNISHCAKN